MTVPSLAIKIGIANVAKIVFSGLSNPIMYGLRRLIDDNCHYVCLLAV